VLAIGVAATLLMWIYNLYVARQERLEGGAAA
jgi:hypothetical protein